MTNGDDAPRREPGGHTLVVDGGWGLLELSELGRQYTQVYSFLYGLMAAEEEGGVAENRLQRAFRAHPWRGGWSSVNFFSSLVDAVPEDYALRIERIEFASPGSIELLAAVGPARQTRHVVETVCAHPSLIVSEAYKRLHGEAQARGLLRRDVKERPPLAHPDSRFAAAAADELVRLMGLQTYVTQLSELTLGNPLSVMKVVFALYRRVRVLAELQDGQKIRRF